MKYISSTPLHLKLVISYFLKNELNDKGGPKS